MIILWLTFSLSPCYQDATTHAFSGGIVIVGQLETGCYQRLIASQSSFGVSRLQTSVSHCSRIIRHASR